MLTITHTSYSCHEVLAKKSTDSSPSHSQISRNSSKKSNNSLLVNNGKLEGKKHSFLYTFFLSCPFKVRKMGCFTVRNCFHTGNFFRAVMTSCWYIPNLAVIDIRSLLLKLNVEVYFLCWNLLQYFHEEILHISNVW